MNVTIRAALLAATTVIATAGIVSAKDSDTATTSTKDYVVLKVGNEVIKNSDVIETWKNLFPAGQAPDFNSFDENIRQNVLRGLVSERLIYNEAIEAGYDKDTEVKQRLEHLSKQVVMQGFMENKAEKLVTDEQLRTAYAKKVAASKGEEEVRARHIMVASEDEANKIYKEVKNGKDFEKIAKEKSADKGSGANGGELGWFTKERMVPAFADAAFKLKKDEVSKPVKSEFGWHVIKLEDRRKVKVPSFDEMKESLKAEAANKAVQTYVEKLLSKADVKYYDANGKEKPFSTSLTPEAGKAATTTKKKQ